MFQMLQSTSYIQIQWTLTETISRSNARIRSMFEALR